MVIQITLKKEIIGMQLNETDKMAISICKKIRNQLEDKISSMQIFDVVEDVNHRAFKIKFIAYDYFVVIFQYELDIIGCSIEIGKSNYISLVKEKKCYSDCNFDEYLLKVKEQLELRIPDKYLASQGWLKD